MWTRPSQRHSTELSFECELTVEHHGRPNASNLLLQFRRSSRMQLGRRELRIRKSRSRAVTPPSACGLRVTVAIPSSGTALIGDGHAALFPPLAARKSLESSILFNMTEAYSDGEPIRWFFPSSHRSIEARPRIELLLSALHPFPCLA